MKTSDKRKKTMLEVSKGYEDFIKGKRINKNGCELFGKALKKAAKPKQRGSK